MKKSFKKCNETHKSSSQKQSGRFKSALNDPFDIAYQDALKNIHEGTQFLLLQRNKGHLGCMAGVDVKIL